MTFSIKSSLSLIWVPGHTDMLMDGSPGVETGLYRYIDCRTKIVKRSEPQLWQLVVFHVGPIRAYRATFWSFDEGVKDSPICKRCNLEKETLELSLLSTHVYWVDLIRISIRNVQQFSKITDRLILKISKRINKTGVSPWTANASLSDGCFLISIFPNIIIIRT